LRRGFARHGLGLQREAAWRVRLLVRVVGAQGDGEQGTGRRVQQQ
jgi:hypothetical protein